MKSISAKEFLKELFEDSYCEECGGDVQHHTAIPNVPVKNSWFARCDYPCDENGKLHPVIKKFRKEIK